MLAATGAHNIFGCSSGAIIVPEATLALSTAHRTVIFEPPLFADVLVPQAILTRFDQQMAEGNIAGERRRHAGSEDRVELSGAGHTAVWNSDRGGQPHRVAQLVRRLLGPDRRHSSVQEPVTWRTMN